VTIASTRRTFLQTTGAAVLGAPSSFPAATEQDLRLWYREPASDWNEALPIGNGWLGAMMFGGVAEERLQMNADTLTSGEPGTGELPLRVTGNLDQVETCCATVSLPKPVMSSRSTGLGAPGPVISR